MLPDDKVRCPHTGFQKTCKSIVTKYTCPKFVHILGPDPQTGAPIDQCGCIDSFLHKLLIENSKMQMHTAAGVDKVATEIAKSADRNAEFAHHLSQQMQETIRQIGHEPAALMDITPKPLQIERKEN